MNLFKPYDGNEPYVFVSYAHRDSAEVIPLLNRLHDLGFRIWYDEGLELGCMWTESVASHLKDSELMLSFISDAYMDSENCKREMNYAVGMNKKIINVFLCETEMSPGMELQIGGIWALMKYSFDDEEKFMQKLLAAPMLYTVDLGAEAPEEQALSRTADEENKEQQAALSPETKTPANKESRKNKKTRKNKNADNPGRKPIWPKIVILSVLALSLIAAAVLLIVGNHTGFNQRFIKSRFPKSFVLQKLDINLKPDIKNNMLRNVAVEYSGKCFEEITVGDLRGLSELYICGDRYSLKKEFEDIEIREGENAAKARLDESEVFDISRGGIESLEDFKYFPDLKKLQLCYQNIKSLAKSGPSAIEKLDLRYNKLENLEGIKSFDSLKILKAENNKLEDISELSHLNYPEELYLRDNPITKFESLKTLPFLKKFSASDISSESIRPLFYSEKLEELELSNCKLTAGFFDMLNRKSLIKLKLLGCTLSGLNGIEETNIVELWLIEPLGQFDLKKLSEVKSLGFLHVDEETAKHLDGNISFKVIAEDKKKGREK